MWSKRGSQETDANELAGDLLYDGAPDTIYRLASFHWRVRRSKLNLMDGRLSNVNCSM